MAEAEPKEVKSYLPQKFDKLTPMHKGFTKMLFSDWAADLSKIEGKAEGYEYYLKVAKLAEKTALESIGEHPSPQSVFPDDAPFKRTVVSPHGELTCECTIYEPLEASENQLMFIYIHGGGMFMFDGKGMMEWDAAKYAIAGHIGVIVHFTNSTVEPYPRGLNDVCSAIRYAHKKFKPSGVCLYGDSGGANLVTAATMKLTQNGEQLVDCIYVSCPYLHPILGIPDDCGIPEDISGSVQEFYPEKESLFDINFRAGFWCYKGPDKDAVEHLHDPFAWPYFATEEHFKNFPPTYIVSNECDVLKDVGLRFFRQLQAAGVQAYHVTEAGTFHAGEIWDQFYAEIVMERRVTFLKMVLKNQKKESQKEG